jgi:hypothetical protein
MLARRLAPGPLLAVHWRGYGLLGLTWPVRVPCTPPYCDSGEMFLHPHAHAHARGKRSTPIDNVAHGLHRLKKPQGGDDNFIICLSIYQGRYSMITIPMFAARVCLSTLTKVPHKNRGPQPIGAVLLGTHHSPLLPAYPSRDSGCDMPSFSASGCKKDLLHSTPYLLVAAAGSVLVLMGWRPTHDPGTVAKARAPPRPRPSLARRAWPSILSTKTSLPHLDGPSHQERAQVKRPKVSLQVLNPRRLRSRERFSHQIPQRHMISAIASD